MSVSETLFLAMGLLLGVAAGATLVLVLRARPPAPREVRVTVTADAVPRRASTLADDPFAGAAADPARGGPADRRTYPGLPPIGLAERRTSVLGPTTMTLALGAVGAGTLGAVRSVAPRTMVVSADERRPDPVAIPVQADGPTFDASRYAPRAEGPITAVGAVAVLERTSPIALAGAEPTASGPGPSPGETSGDAATSAGSADPAAQTDPGSPCADERRLADERCELAGRSRTQVGAAEASLRASQREYDEHAARAVAASEAADPRAVRRAKDAAQAGFRTARGGAATTEDVESAAREWLAEINRVNTAARDAAAEAAREQEAVRVLMLDLDRMAMDVEATRIAAETAEAACLAARDAVAACEEAAANPTPAAPTGGPADGDRLPAEDMALGGPGTPRIFRLVRGDRSAMVELVDAMAGDDPVARRRWQTSLSDLVDAILADSIAAASLEFPADHPFWGPFTREQDREIAQALSSLGYRFDGLGGWVDGRIPSQRDLSLALGYAGIDPMRIRQWPTESEMSELFADVAVAADERLAGAAGDLTLGELVTMLGRRADGLAEVWNQWGRLRPLMLEES